LSSKYFLYFVILQALFALPDSDALSRVKVISLPNGCNSLPPALLPLLERFKKIYLWFDNDASGQAASLKFSKKLGIHRCLIVQPLAGDSKVIHA